MNRIKELRNLKGETQEELGKVLNLSKATISKYESGDLDLSSELLLKLSNHYNVSTDYLLGNTNNPTRFLDEPIIIAAQMKDDSMDLSDLSDQEKKFITDFVKMVREKNKNNN